MKKNILLVLALAVSINTLFVVAEEQKSDSSQGKKNYHGVYNRNQEFKLENMVDLSEAQKANIEQIRKEYRDLMQNVKKSYSHSGFLELDPEDPQYIKKVKAMAKSRGALVEKKTILNAERRAKIYAVLTPAQKTQLKDIRDSAKITGKKMDNTVTE